MDAYIQEIFTGIIIGFTAIVIISIVVKGYSNIKDKKIDSPERVLFQKIIH